MWQAFARKTIQVSNYLQALFLTELLNCGKW
jgi:hypothetical protein